MYLALIALLLTACTSCAHFPTRSAVEQHNALVMLEVTCLESDGKVSKHNGSGVLVAPDQVLTAQHVAGCRLIEDFPIFVPAAEIRVFFIGQEHVTGVETAFSTRADVSRVKLSKPLPFSEVSVGPKPSVGEQVCVTTARPRVSFKCGPAMVSTADTVSFSIFTEHGNSGSAIYNAAGQLVGIVTNMVRCEDGVPCEGYGAALASYRWLFTGVAE